MIITHEQLTMLMHRYLPGYMSEHEHNIWSSFICAVEVHRNYTCEITEQYIHFCESQILFNINTHPYLKGFIEYILSLNEHMDGITTNYSSLNSELLTCNCCETRSTIAASLAGINQKENKKMFDFDFGKITSDNVRMSMYGIAVKNVEGRYVSYDKNTHSVMDVEILNMPAGDFLYKMPVAIKDVKAGDVIIHNRVPMFVVEPHESTLKVIDIREGTEKEIYLTKSPFNFNFATKVVSLMDMTGAKANEDNPFGSMLPFMLMGDSKDATPLMLMALMNDSKLDMSNPMMLYFLMKDSNKDMLPLLMMTMQK